MPPGLLLEATTCGFTGSYHSCAVVFLYSISRGGGVNSSSTIAIHTDDLFGEPIDFNVILYSPGRTLTPHRDDMIHTASTITHVGEVFGQPIDFNVVVYSPGREVTVA